MYEELNSSVLRFLSNNLGWEDLNEIQKKAIPSILDNKDTLILAPTASGKTEAALIPIFSEIINKQLEPVSVLYVAPLKALINDIHARIESWGNYFGITAMKWHGDVGPSKRNKFIKNPTDFLAITPESLEVILMNKQSGIKERIFKNLKYIIIDEIHYFADSDRGVQLNSILNRISKYFTNEVVTIGLSATVGNPELISEWIDTEHPANVVKVEGKSKVLYKIISLDQDSDDDNPFDYVDILKPYVNDKVLIFTKSKFLAESIHYKLKRQLKLDNIFIHHGSISKEVREENEKRFKEVDNAFMISTSTLELGIDIGNLDIVINFEMPNNVSSFSQRIGRCGRRTKIQKTINLVKCIEPIFALSEILLHKESETEDINISRTSKDIFFHQMLSALFERGNIHVKELYSEIHNCFAFSNISYDDCKFLLKSMQENDFVEINHNQINLGLGFEEEFGSLNFMNFYAVFNSSYDFKIFEGDNEVGTLDACYAIKLSPGEDFVLAGRYWEVLSIDYDKYLMNVKSKSLIKHKIPRWSGGGNPFSYIVCRKIYDILLGNFDKRALKPLDVKAKETVENLMRKSEDCGFKKGIIPVYYDVDNNQLYIYTFAGLNANLLLSDLFNMFYEIKNEEVTNLYYSLDCSDFKISDFESLMYNVEDILNDSSTERYMDEKTISLRKNKFINYLPEENSGRLKMDLLYDQKGLIDLIMNNKISYIENNSIYKSLAKWPNNSAVC